MIFTVILNFFDLLLVGLLSLLPSGHLPVQIANSFATFWGIANQFNYIFPIAALMEAIVVIVAFDAAILIWHFLNWIIRKIPGMQ